MAPCNRCPDLVNTAGHQSTPFSAPFRKIPSHHHLASRQEDSPQEFQIIALAVTFGVVVLLFLFFFVMFFSPWRKLSRKVEYERVDLEDAHETERDTRQDWPLITDARSLTPPRPRLEEQIRKLWESSREKNQRSPARARDSMDLGEFDDIDLATPWKKDQTFEEKTNYKDHVEVKEERNWVRQPVKGQGASHKQSDQLEGSKSTNNKLA